MRARGGVFARFSARLLKQKAGSPGPAGRGGSGGVPAIPARGLRRIARVRGKGEKMNDRRSVRRGAAALALAAATAAAGGCAQWPAQTPTSPASVESRSPVPEPGGLPQPVAEFLTSAPAGASRPFERTPWGAGAVLGLGPAYHAASGRVCRRVEITGPERPVPDQLACALGAGAWEAVPAPASPATE